MADGPSSPGWRIFGDIIMLLGWGFFFYTGWCAYRDGRMIEDRRYGPTAGWQIMGGSVGGVLWSLSDLIRTIKRLE